MKDFLIFLSLVFLIFLGACSAPATAEEDTYLRWVGDIQFNREIDDNDFRLCYTDDDIRQYFNFGKGVRYQGEKPAIDQYFKDNYQAVETDQSGLIRIRFVVNCKGETGRFRLMAMDANYNAMEFEPAINEQLLQLTQAMEGWLPIQMDEMDNMTLDYYQYLIFKIEKGEIIEIMP